MSYGGKITINGVDYPIATTLYKRCTTGAGDTPKVVQYADFDTLMEGVVIAVYFEESNTAVNPQLQVGTTPAKIIYTDNINPVGDTPATSWPAKSVVLFLYDGNVWRIINTTKALRTELVGVASDLSAETERATAAEAVLTEAVGNLNTGKEPKTLKFTNKSATFTSGNGITNFGYRAAVPCEGVTSDMIPYVSFSGNNAGSGDYAPYCQTYNGGVYLYAAVSGTITVPSIVFWRP